MRALLPLVALVACSKEPELSERGRALVKQVKEAAEQPSGHPWLKLTYLRGMDEFTFQGDGQSELRKAGQRWPGHTDDAQLRDALDALVQSGLLERAFAPIEDELLVEGAGVMIKVRVPRGSQLDAVLLNALDQFRKRNAIVEPAGSVLGPSPMFGPDSGAP